MKLNFKYSKEELLELKSITDKLRELEKNELIELNETLLNQLVSSFINNFRFPNFYIDKLFEEPYIGACGCLGPRDGDLYCSCRMYQLQYDYRYDVALKVLEIQEQDLIVIQEIKDNQKLVNKQLLDLLKNLK